MNNDNRDRVVTMGLGPNNEWTCELEWPEGERRGGPRTLVIRPSDPDSYPTGGISSTIVREIDFRTALETLRKRLEPDQRSEEQRQKAREAGLARLHRFVGTGITDEYLAVLSREYLRAVDDGVAKPLGFLAKETGQSHAAIKRHLWQATRRGLLQRTPGRAGGTLTDKANELLAKHGLE